MQQFSNGLSGQASLPEALEDKDLLGSAAGPADVHAACCGDDGRTPRAVMAIERGVVALLDLLGEEGATDMVSGDAKRVGDVLGSHAVIMAEDRELDPFTLIGSGDILDGEGCMPLLRFSHLLCSLCRL